MDDYIQQLHVSIDHALTVSYRRSMYDGKAAFVAHISLIKGVPFYGYHVGHKLFLKIYMLNPLHMTRLADLLRQGAILKKVIQPYESHMQYLAQWMCDFNLYGCAFIDCSAVKFRSPVPQYLDLNSSIHRWHDQTIDASLISDQDRLPRQSHCPIEIDVCVQNILNRLDVKSRPIHHDFIERETPVAPSEKFLQSMACLWRDETRRRRARMGEIDSESSPFPPEVLISVSADPRHSQPGGWIHEDEFAEKVRNIIELEEDKGHGERVDFKNFVSRTPFENQVRSSSESVEDLFPENIARVILSQKASQAVSNGFKERDAKSPEVDESHLLSYEEDEYSYASDEELARESERPHKLQDNQAEAYMEQLPGEGLDRAMYDNENRLDGIPNTEERVNVHMTTSERAPRGSSYLEKAGIRNYGDHVDLQADAFDIPADFISEMSANGAQDPSDLEPGCKRRKKHHNRNSGEEVSSNLSSERPDIHLANAAEVGFKDGTPSSNSIVAPFPKLSQSLAQIDMQKDKHGKYTLLSVSQEKAIGNRTLTFSMVKDPQDSNSNLKLSQNSNSPIRECDKGKSKSVSCVSASTPNAASSKETKTVSWRSSPSSKLGSFTSSDGSSRFSQIRLAFDIPTSVKILCIQDSAPPTVDTLPELKSTRLLSVIYQDAYYSNERDVPDRAREYGGKEYRLESVTVPFLPPFDSTGTSIASIGEKPGSVIDKSMIEHDSRRRRIACAIRTWEIEGSPPSREEVQQWSFENNERHIQMVDLHKDEEVHVEEPNFSQVDGPTQKNRRGFKYSQKQRSTSVQHETQYMSLMGLEIHVNTRGNLVPNPEEDRVECVFWCLQSDYEDLEVNGMNVGTHVGVLVLADPEGPAHKMSQHTGVEVEEEVTELDLLTRMVDIVRMYDPDILTGYEVHGGSWGYIIERARYKYELDLCDEFSRMKSQSHGRFRKEDDRWGFNHTSTIRVTGRHTINIWRAMRGELNLLQYTMENVVFHLCHRRIPHYSFHDLTSWYTSGKPQDLVKVVDYFVLRVQLDLEILEQNELVPRTSEQARLLGVDFFSVFSRGSQFKVESLMFRIAKPENFLLPSPSRKQVGQQNALECLPLVIEPQSAFYNSPLLVLDFQSLYPSVMIAYNYCYSTFLGRVFSWRGQNKMGFSNYEREPRLLELLKDQINIAPNGIMYAKPGIRKSLLAKMLGEILETRVMVKSGMRVDKDDKTLQRLLNNRQLALKLIANVTYGYTSASFSGRMPCSEIADSIVQTGRETLEKAIALIHSVERWGAEVVYGDTDSLFVYLKGRTKDQAFDIGQEIAKTVTDMNPRPVKLKFEKVYFPCVLLAKKRYVGFKYESKTQVVPDFDAKGIETVRRDGTPAEQKIEEKALKILFRTADLSEVKTYFQKQCAKIMKGKVSIQDFCFAREVKLGTYSDKGLPPPGAMISTRRMLEDPRAEPQYGERVPYVVITGAPGARLIDRCVTPDVLLYNDNSELDAEYYISKNIIPPLERIFNLVGANVRQWYDEMPKHQRIRRVKAGLLSSDDNLSLSKRTLESYMKSSSCLVCYEKLVDESIICTKCTQHADSSLMRLSARLNRAEKKAINIEDVCRSCSGLAWGEDVRCDSKDCPVFYTRTRHRAEMRSSRMISEPILGVLKELGAGDLDW